MQYGCSLSKDYNGIPQVVIRDFESTPKGRVLAIIPRESQHEVDFYLWAKSAGLDPKRPSEAFKYEWNGERWYHPDFYIPSLDLYVEVKGYETDRDRAKWLHFPKKLCIIRQVEIRQIRKGCFVGL